MTWDLRNSRRDFIGNNRNDRSIVCYRGNAGAYGVSFQLLSQAHHKRPLQRTKSGTVRRRVTSPAGAIANTNQLKVGTPVYFDYPYSGYPNMLMKKSDGLVSAISMLCTHVCCQCEYSSSSSEIFCPCHGSAFDQNGKVLRGPLHRSQLPSVELTIDANGNIFPVKIESSFSACVKLKVHLFLFSVILSALWLLCGLTTSARKNNASVMKYPLLEGFKNHQWSSPYWKSFNCWGFLDLDQKGNRHDE